MEVYLTRFLPWMCQAFADVWTPVRCPAIDSYLLGSNLGSGIEIVRDPVYIIPSRTRLICVTKLDLALLKIEEWPESSKGMLRATFLISGHSQFRLGLFARH